MKQKKLMLLGGIRYLLPAIEAAHKLGCHVITVDYLPDNIAHKYSDEYHNVSILDKDAVLKLARELQIDGILSYAVDPGVVSAAYVAEKMGLPFSCSYESACILQDKSRFRQFLSENGFNVPNAKGYADIKEALTDVDFFNWPVIVKPVDSAGSKGVSRVDDPKDLEKAIVQALEESHNGHFIIEDFLEKEGTSSGSESFFVEGELLYNGFYDQFFDAESLNPYTPSAESWPSTQKESHIEEIQHELQRLGNLLHFRTGLFNVEWRVCKNGKAYLMEVSPRAGGNRLAEMLNYAADVDIIDAEVRKSLSMEIQSIHAPNYNGCYTIYVLHSKVNGIFEGLEIRNDFPGEILEEELRVHKGDHVEAFNGANNAIGSIFIKFQNRTKCDACLSHMSEYVKVKVTKN